MKLSAKYWQSLVLLMTATALLNACGNETAPPEPPAPRFVDATEVQATNAASQVSLSGRVRAVERTVLSFEVSGEIAEIHVDVGDAIEQGQVLASLDAERYRLVLNQAQASATEAQAALTEKQLDYNRLQELKGKGFVSEANLDSARAALETARSRLNSALASVSIAERDVALTQIKAPFAGSVSDRRAEPAQRVSPNQPVLEAISERGGFEVYTHVPEALVSKFKRGSQQEVIIPALSNQRLEAAIEHIGTRPESSNNYPLVLALNNANVELRSGMTAQALLSPQSTQSTQANTVLVPLTSLLHGEEQTVSVMRINSDYTLEPVAIEVIEARAKKAEVKGPLKVGDRIVARGVEFVAPGEQVAILGEGPERFN
ncbi:efflux RND transporter periplasmic adaptor subunit [Gilvimarinus agarilyticus]|uniref:efflux RND transporter periplasmic adaptor subunit n=1 Tax=Gilvimarinus sp. 2_MG-2023 TaxID=3062666 RepID=UPI001C080B5B|nr:efflux RND transporter periplasmic adaptor subunit [Gilvimarinus sp. 2_MG-2023]MBU2886553.1 efflux RND transporter periplasmic adaptor subunit [Gilvimarinus agarilyticus]MDO6571221.1 efflux RND transporter periplasmic adaptor subunit [Gilvimarinus sp. 2_MG-2023]